MISYFSTNFWKDHQAGKYSQDSRRHPADVVDGSLDLTITLADLDENGLYFLKDPNDATKPWLFITSKLYIDIDLDDYLNMDFLGSYFYWYNSVNGVHSDGKVDDWTVNEVGNFHVKGIFNIMKDNVETKHYFNLSLNHIINSI